MVSDIKNGFFFFMWCFVNLCIHYAQTVSSFSLYILNVWYYNTQGMMNFFFLHFVNWFLLLHAAGKLLMFYLVVTSLYQWHKSVCFCFTCHSLNLWILTCSAGKLHFTAFYIIIQDAWPMTWSLVFSYPLPAVWTCGFLYVQLVGCLLCFLHLLLCELVY